MTGILRPKALPVRTLATYLLVSFLLACPFLCKAGEPGCCAGHCEDAESQADDSQRPPPPQDEPVSCICAGAIHGTGVRNIPAPAPTGSLLPLDGRFGPGVAPASLSLAARLARDGASRDLAGRGGGRRIQTLLGQYRC